MMHPNDTDGMTNSVYPDQEQSGNQVIKKKIMLNSAEHEILDAFKNSKKFSFFQA